MEARRHELRRAFRRGELTPQSSVNELKYIGDYLGSRLRASFGGGRAGPLTVARLAAKTRNLSGDRLRKKISEIMQNLRGNQCVPVSSRRPRALYHVPEVNRGGWITLVALFKTLHRGDDGYGLAPRGYRADLSLFRDRQRTEDAKRCGCFSRPRSCRASPTGCVWMDRLCQPASSRARGYPGVGSRPGQKISARNRRDAQRAMTRAARQPSRRARDRSTRRDRRMGNAPRRYANRTSRVRWRRPGSVVRYAMRT